VDEPSVPVVAPARLTEQQRALRAVALGLLMGVVLRLFARR
jgi:hypothetical protein